MDCKYIYRMVELVPCSPLSAASCASEHTDKVTSPWKPSKEGAAPDHETTQAVEPVSIDSNDKMMDALDNLLRDEELDDYLKKTDDLEQRCYDYLVSVIGSNDLLAETMQLYRGHTDFLIMSKHKSEVWIRGEISPSGFNLRFSRHSKRENQKVDGVYLEVNEVFKNEAFYRVSRAMTS